MKRYMLSAVAFLDLSASVQAATISQQTGFITAGPAAGLFENGLREQSLEQFDSSLGMLSAVQVNVQGFLTSTVTDDGSVPPAGPLVSANVSVGLRSAGGVLSGPTVVVTAPLTSSTSATFSANFNNTFSFSDPRPFLTFGNSFIVTPDVFSQALASGSTVETDSIAYNITETFAYDPIPEPATLALLGGGLGSLVMLGRRRRPVSESRHPRA